MSNIGRITGSFTTPASGTTVITVDDAFAAHFWYSRVTADDTVQADQQFGHGFAAGTLRDCGMTAGEDGVNQNQRDGRDANWMLITDPAGTTDVVLGSSAVFNAGNVTLSYTTFSSGFRVHYEIWYGTDGSAEMREVAASTSPISDLTMTTPDMVMVWTLGQGHPAASIHGYQSFGVAVDNAGIDQWVQYTYMGDSDTDSVGSALVDGQVGGQYNVDFTNWTMDISAIGSNGCAWNGTNADAVVFLFLDLAGDAVHVGTFAKSTTAAPTTQQMPTFGFTPDGYGIATCNFDLQTINTNRIVVNSFGAYDEETGVGHSALSVGTASSNADRASWSSPTEVLAGSVALQASGIQFSGTPDAITDATPSIEWNPNTTGGTDDVIIGVYGHEQQAATPLTASGTPSIDTITASGVASQILMPSGTPTIDTVTASGVVNIIKTATGAAVLATIVAAGTIAPFVRDASGTPSIDTVEASGVATIFKRASGTPSIDTITASGQATQVYKPTGTPSIDGVTASGVAALGALTADGTPAIDTLTAAGVVDQIKAARGGDALPAAFGTVVKTARQSGNQGTFTPNLGSNPTAGNLLIFTAASGDPTQVVSVAPVDFTLLHAQEGGDDATWYWYYKISDGDEQTAAFTWDGAVSGAANLTEYVWGGGTPQSISTDENTGNISADTSSQLSGAAVTLIGKNLIVAMHGIAGNANGITGAAVAGWIEDTVFTDEFDTRGECRLSHQAHVAAGQASYVDTDTADRMYGAVAGFTPASTGPSIEVITANGVATTGGVASATGTPAIDVITAAGTVTQVQKPSGTPAIDTVEASGVVNQFKKADGTPSIDVVTASGQAIQTQLASGTPSIEVIEASGTAIIADILASGTPALDVLTAAGIVNQIYMPSGSPELDVLTASGIAAFRHQASGTPSIEEITASGIGTLAGEVSAIGSPDIDTLTASGVVDQIQKPSGTPSIDVITASGVASLGALAASGTPALDQITALGIAAFRHEASGTPALDTLTALGIAGKLLTASGTPSIEEITASGVASTQGLATASGTPSLDVLTASGSATQIYKPSGTPAIDAVTAVGSVTQIQKPSGTPSIETVTASGLALNLVGPIAVGSPVIEVITARGLIKGTGPATLAGFRNVWTSL